jgi:hypothetical protein
MLTPHEFATLMLVKDATQQSEFDPADLLALVDRKLIDLDRPDSARLPRVTERGQQLLARLYGGGAHQ